MVKKKQECKVFKKKLQKLNRTVINKRKSKSLKTLHPQKIVKRVEKRLKPKIQKKPKTKGYLYADYMTKVRGWVPPKKEEVFSESSISNRVMGEMQTFANYSLDELKDEENEATGKPETKLKEKKAKQSTVALLPVLTDDGWDYPNTEPEGNPAMNNKEAETTNPDQDEKDSLPDEDEKDSLPDKDEKDSLPDEDEKDSLPDEDEKDSLSDQDDAQPPSSGKGHLMPDQDIDLPVSCNDDCLTPEQRKQMLLHLVYPSQTSKTVTQLWADQQRHIREKKALIASLALNGIQTPMMTKNLRFLIKILRESSPESEVTIRRYCCLTLAQVFHDQIPGYKMQDERVPLKLKKEVYATVKIEMEFLTCYRMYLKTMEETLTAWKENRKHFGLKQLAETALYCFGELLALHPHFNYSVNIIQLLVPYLNSKNEKMREIASSSLSRTFKGDEHNFLTLKIVRRIYRFAQRMRFNVNSDLLQVFLHLPLHNMKNPDSVKEQENKTENTLRYQNKLIKKFTKAQQPILSKKERKNKKRLAKIRGVVADVMAEQELARDTTRNSFILEKVFGVYIHLLKRKPNSDLMPHVLEGLSRYAHLISITYFSDILSVLNDFLVEKKLKKKDFLFCVHTIFSILSGQGKALTVDPHQVYCEFYKVLQELNPSEVCNHLSVILSIIDHMLISQKWKISMKKVVAFTKRLTTLLLTLPHHGAIPLLFTIIKLFKSFSCTKALLETEDAGFSGLYLPEVNDPDYSNSEAGVLWELILTQRHYHSYVRMLSTAIFKEPKSSEARQISHLTRRSPQALREDLGSTNLKFYPPIPIPSTHLYRKKQTKKKVFYQNKLTLSNAKLQKLVDEAHEVNVVKQPPQKKIKIEDQTNLGEDSDNLIYSIDFYPRVPLNEVRKEEKTQFTVQEMGKSSSHEANAEDSIAEDSEPENFLSYYI